MLLVYMLHFIFIYDFNTILKCSFIATTIIHIVCFRLNYKNFFHHHNHVDAIPYSSEGK